MLEIRPRSEVVLVKIFSHSVGCRFVLLTMSFALQKLFSFTYCFSQCLCCWVIFRKWSPVPMRSSVLPTFSSVRFSVADFMLRSLIHLDLSFVHGDRHGSIFILLHVDIKLYHHHLLNMLSFLFFIFRFFVKKSGVIGVWIGI